MLNVTRATIISLLLSFFLTHSVLSQQDVRGLVTNQYGDPLPFAAIIMENGPVSGTKTDVDGAFYIPYLYEGTYQLVASYTGYDSKKVEIIIKEEDVRVTIQLEEDVAELKATVRTGTFAPESKLKSNASITTVNFKEIEPNTPEGPGELLSSISGVYVDRSGGNINNRVFVRGLTTGSINFWGQPTGTGFRYVSLQEDGLPVISTMMNGAAPDYIHRADRTIARLEAVKGGSSSIAAPNSPGGIFNFISKIGGLDFGGEAQLSFGAYDNQRAMTRADYGFGGAINDEWRYYVGGFYRMDEGPREVSGIANMGGQLKGNLAYFGKNTTFKFHLKYLNDKNGTYSPVPISSISNTQSFRDFDPRHSTIYPDVSQEVTDFSTFPELQQMEFNTQDGSASEVISGMVELEQRIGGKWSVVNKTRVSKLDLGMNRFTEISRNNEFLNLPDIRLFDLTSNELYTQEEVADGFVTLGAATSTTDVTDLINELSILYKTDRHQVTIGAYGAVNQSEVHYRFNALTTLLEPELRVVGLEQTNPYLGWSTPGETGFDPITGPATIAYTDENGYWGNNLALLPSSETTTLTLAGYLNDVWKVNDQVSLFAGFRFETITYQG
ncbi:MAG: carboxypeptidase-like regulatory domain-containing protein, partial [Bacteroidota bacterium]